MAFMASLKSLILILISLIPPKLYTWSQVFDLHGVLLRHYGRQQECRTPKLINCTSVYETKQTFHRTDGCENRISKKQKRSKILMLGLHSEYSNYRDSFAVGTLKFVRIIEVFELQRFE